MRARVQSKWLKVVFVRSGPGPDRTRLVPSTGRSWSLAGLPVFVSRSNCQSVNRFVCLSVCLSGWLAGCVSVSVSPSFVGLLGKTATSCQSAVLMSVGELRDSRAVKKVSNGTSDMMTEDEGVQRGDAVSGQVVVIERDGRRPVVATGLRLSCDTTATVPAHSLRLYFFCCSLRSAVCSRRAGRQRTGEHQRKTHAIGRPGPAQNNSNGRILDRS